MTLKLLHTHSSLFLLALRGAHLILLSSSLFTRTHLCSLLAWYAVPMVWMCFSQMYVFESIKIRVAFIYVNLFAIAIMRGAPPLGSRSTFTIYHQSRPNRTLQIRDDNMPSNNEKRWRTLRFFMKIPINFTPFQFQWRTVLCICTWCLKLFKVFISM